MSELFTAEDDRKFHFWNTAPPDPIALKARHDIPHYNQVLGRVLMPDSYFPLGTQHRDKTMRNVPAEHYRWLQSQPWFATSEKWAPVRDYLARFPIQSPTHRPPPA